VRKGGGGPKGSAFERRIAKQLSLWLYGSDDLLWRVGGSGGRAARARGSRLYAGDIVPSGLPLPYPFILFVECKHYRNVDFHCLFTPPKSKNNLVAWWRKARNQAPSHQRLILLIVKQNSKPTLVVMHKTVWKQFASTNSIAKIRRASCSENMVILKLDDLFTLDAKSALCAPIPRLDVIR
jgi:hypothetical protein